MPGYEHYTTHELAAMDLPPLSYLVPGVIPKGTSLLAGPPKSGKSMLALNIALGIAR